MTNDRGEYRIFGLKPGEYYIKASESMAPDIGIDSDPIDFRFLRTDGNEYAPLYYPGVLQVTDAQPIPLRAGEEMQADFAMRRVKTVETAGRVVGADGKPATDTFLTLRRAGLDEGGADLQPVFTDSRGEFVIKAVPPGSYNLSAQQQHNDQHFTARQKIEVGEYNLESVVLSFGQGTDIHGRVITEGSGAALDRIGAFLDSQSEDDNVPQRWAQVKPKSA